jgi:hypothetical protein
MGISNIKQAWNPVYEMSCSEKFIFSLCHFLPRLYLLCRVGLFLGYYPCIYLLNNDRQGFYEAYESDLTKNIIVPATDTALFVCAMLLEIAMEVTAKEDSVFTEVFMRDREQDRRRDYERMPLLI